jgi:hypothetical protein
VLADSRKIHLIEEVLKLEDQTILKEIEAILVRPKIKRVDKKIDKKRFLLELKESIKEVSLAKQGKATISKEFYQ